jgi:hypothetical protein
MALKKLRTAAMQQRSKQHTAAAAYTAYSYQQPGQQQALQQTAHVMMHVGDCRACGIRSCRITVKSLSERTDLPALAAEVVEKCKLIHPSKVRVHNSSIMMIGSCGLIVWRST